EILPSAFDLLRRAYELRPGFGVLQIEPSSLGAVGWRLEIRAAAGRRIHEKGALRARIRSGHRLRPPLFVEAGIPVLVDARAARGKGSVGPVEHVEMRVAIRVQQKLARLPGPKPIDEH